MRITYTRKKKENHRKMVIAVKEKPGYSDILSFSKFELGHFIVIQDTQPPMGDGNEKFMMERQESFPIHNIPDISVILFWAILMETLTR